MRSIALILVVVLALVSTGEAQRRGGGRGGGRGGFSVQPAVPEDFDGSWQFCRVAFREASNGDGGNWSVDYPRADQNLSIRLSELTKTPVSFDDRNEPNHLLITLSQDELFRCPFIMMTEVGSVYLDETEAENLRKYLLKGGFMIFDDFRERWRGQYDFSALQNHMSRAIPTAKWVQLTGKEPIFDSFFKIDLNGPISGTSAYGTNKPTFWGVYQDNDPKKRLIVIANVDNDIGESWEYSAAGFVPIAAANETYKLGINYVIYALTH